MDEGGGDDGRRRRSHPRGGKRRTRRRSSPPPGPDGRDDDARGGPSDAESVDESSLRSLLLAIADERKRDYDASEAEKEAFLLIKDHNALWASMFSKHFIDSPDDTHKDDLLFYVRKTFSESNEDAVLQPSIEVYRKWSSCKPALNDPEIDFEETIYLNFILQHFEYYVACAVCQKTVDQRPKLLRKLAQRVYASPSRRKMDSKGTEEEIAYPNIFFTIDNFEEAFYNQVIQENETICVELVAVDCASAFRVVLFRGCIGYDALKRVFDAKASLGLRMPLGWWFKEPDRVEFIRMVGPNGKGFAEMAVSCAKTSATTTHSSQVITTDVSNKSSDELHSLSRRSSDPNFGWRRIFNGSLKRVGLKKSRSNMENLGQDGMSSSCTEGAERIDSDSVDECDESTSESKIKTSGGKPMSQSWSWWREKRSAVKASVALNSYLTYVSLPWHRIISDLCGENGEIPAYFFSEEDRVNL